MSKDFEIFDGNTSVAILDLAWLGERGEIKIGGHTYEVGRRGMLSGAFFLRRGGETIVSATKPSASVARSR